MGERLIIFDFDGTLTDAEAEGAPFRDGYLQDISTLVGAPQADLEAEAQHFEAEVAAAPERYGWLFGGAIVAPATVDPYLRMMPVARALLDRHQRLMDPADRERVLDGLLYKYNYQKTKTVFRDGAAALLKACLASPRTMTAVVTNSHTDAVQKKLALLDQESASLPGPRIATLIERVFGRAQKYVLDDDFTALPRSTQLPGLERPVFLRRRRYYEVLEARRAEAGVAWEQVWVIGDIFELDLSLPLELGARVSLVVNDFTPSWERAHLSGHPRASLVGSLEALSAELLTES